MSGYSKVSPGSRRDLLTYWLIANKLSLNVAKTEFIITGSRQRLTAHIKETINIKLNVAIKQVDSSKSLGVTIDSQLSWAEHI